MLEYALKDGVLIHHSELPRELWGIRCGCICPNDKCRAPLIAKTRVRDGHARRRHKHFAHDGRAECAYATESALHLLAKQIIADEMAVMTPALQTGLTRPALATISPPTLLRFDEIRVETTRDGLKPDLTGVAEGQTFDIEIRVTHSATSEKIDHARRNHWTVLEIDLSDLPTKSFSPSELRQRLLEHHQDRNWLRNERLEQAKQLLTESAETLTPGVPCPAGLGICMPPASDESAPCLSCPACASREDDITVCLWRAGIFDAAQLAKGAGSAKEPAFFPEQRFLLTERARERERRARELEQRIRDVHECEEWLARHADDFRSGHRSQPSPEDIATAQTAVDQTALNHCLARVSSQILAEYKRDFPNRPIAYILHLLSSTSPRVVVATYRVGPDIYRQLRRGARPREANTGEGCLFFSGGSYQCRFLPYESPTLR